MPLAAFSRHDISPRNEKLDFSNFQNFGSVSIGCKDSCKKPCAYNNALLKSRYSELSFEVLIVEIAPEKEALHCFQSYMYSRGQV